LRSLNTATPGNWNPLQKFAFRFLFSYCFLFIFPFPFSSIPLINFLTIPWNWFAVNFVALMGQYCFHTIPDPSHLASGSGDQLFRYIEVASYAIVSLPLAALWTMLDEKRKNYSRLFVVLRLWALLFVATNMLSYGASKIIPSQFPPLNDWQLVRRVGDMSPMGMLWTFMSTSKAYTIFTGVAEFTAGLLLACPATTTLGALVSIAVCSQIFALNMCYDVPVKILSFHLLMFSVLIVSPQLLDLFQAFVLHKASKPLTVLKPFKRKGLNLAVWSFVWAMLLYTSVYAFILSQSESSNGQHSTAKTKLGGTWEIVSSECDNQEQERYIKIWKLITNSYGNVVVITSTDKQYIYFDWKFSDDGNSVDITTVANARWNAHFDILKVGTSSLELKGTICGAKATIALAKLARGQEFLLKQRGFHWVNEVPYNR
jgi:hypothetical protein